MSDLQAPSGVASIDATSRSAAAAPSFWDQLQPASFRGVPFAVRSGGGQAGRRNAVHEYPFRDIPWVEDLGRQSRRIQIVGFVNGDDVIAQRAKMLDAVEAPGDGELVHPTLGRIKVAVIGFDWEESEQGRTFAYRFQFVRQGQRLFPSSTADGANAVASASSAAASASNAAFIAKAAVPLSGASQADEVRSQAVAWSAQAQRVGNDATSLIKLAVSLPGNYGRLLGLASGVSVGEIVPTTAGLTPQGLSAAASAARALVASACTALVSAASQIGIGNTTPFTDAVQALATAILNVASTPGDALRGLQSLADFVPAGAATGGTLVVQTACADLFRRAAVITLAVAGSKYQPRSSDDAAGVRTQVLAALDAEITIAGDQIEDGVYASLRALRVQAVKDLNARGASLPGLVTVELASSLPSLVLAQRLYRDPSRADELVSRAAPVHPAFMPRVLKALIS